MKSKDKKFLISQNDFRKTYWELFVIILALYNSFGIPFELSFEPELLKTTIFSILNNCIDITFFIDILLQFRTTFYHPLTGDEIKDLSVIRKNYLRGRFTIDFLSTVPFDKVFGVTPLGESVYLRLLALLKLFRVTRLSRIIARLNIS
mmetsp:Transcript_26915/g.41030  ORF Transcript_26915/g.41030 Transcript_26915/m.41030 type:complete len:148 (-) Transcript_26915:1745-2188(-)